MAHIASRSSARAPEKGVFPLDHFAECKQVRQHPASSVVSGASFSSRLTLWLRSQLAAAYLRCLNQNDSEATACQELSKEYLKCRMDRYVRGKHGRSSQRASGSLGGQHNVAVHVLAACKGTSWLGKTWRSWGWGTQGVSCCLVQASLRTADPCASDNSRQGTGSGADGPQEQQSVSGSMRSERVWAECTREHGGCSSSVVIISSIAIIRRNGRPLH
jgi:hypothetical protein